MSEHEELLGLITHVIHQNGYIIRQEQQVMATLADVQTAVTALTAAAQALEAKESSAAPSVLQTDLDPVVQSLEALTTSLNNLLNAPAPPAS
jgi:hypothetical protein